MLPRDRCAEVQVAGETCTPTTANAEIMEKRRALDVLLEKTLNQSEFDLVLDDVWCDNGCVGEVSGDRRLAAGAGYA